MATPARSLWTFGLLVVPTLAFAQVAQPMPKTPEQERQRLNEPQVAIQFAPDGRQLTVCGQNQSMRQYDAKGIERRVVKNAPGGWSIAYSPDGKTIAVCGLDRTIRLWNAESGEALRLLDGHTQTAWEAQFLPGGHTLVSIGEDATIRFWNVDEGREIGELGGHPGAIWSMALTADGRMLATGASDGTIRLWDLTTGRLRRVFDNKHNGGVWPLLFSPDGRTLASGGWQDNTIYLWEVATGQRRRQVPHASGSKSVAFSPDGRTFITAGNDHVIRFWDLRTGDQLAPLDGHTGTINAIALSPDGKMLASAASDNTIRVWDLSQRVTAAKMAPLPVKQAEVHWAALGRDDALAAFDAQGALAGDPQLALALLRARLQPTAAPDVQRISTLIADTDNVKFAVRQAASAQLEKFGEEAEPQLIRAVSYSPSLETRQRAGRLLQKLENGGLKGESLRAVRAIELLERIGTPEAKEMLKTLSAGAPDTRLTLEAQASLKRMR
jgi:WD40 domain-containing protein